MPLRVTHLGLIHRKTLVVTASTVDMVLRVADSSALTTGPENYLIFYSSIVDGQLWCPDCVAVDDTVQKIFGNAEGPAAVIAYVGNRTEWKSPSNSFRGAPWNVKSIPTIIRLRDSMEDARLVDREIVHKLASFVE